MGHVFSIALDYLLRKGKWWAFVLIGFLMMKEFFAVMVSIPFVGENFNSSSHFENLVNADSVFGENYVMYYGFSLPRKTDDSIFVSFFVDGHLAKDSVKMSYFGGSSREDSVRIFIKNKQNKIFRVKKGILQHMEGFFN